ncbi:MAG: TIGR00296 family protein, partial [Candidatus Bathyarchaeia archaeon]
AFGKNDLRGCIGYSEAIFPVAQATIKAAISSAVEDTRFPPVTAEELDAISIEVSVLSPLQQIKATDYRKQVCIGEDGLVVEQGLNKGLLLPQVAVEWNWDSEDFLSNACLKAGLLPDSWLLPGTKVYKFQVSLFEEEYPKGPVRRVKIDGRSNSQ